MNYELFNESTIDHKLNNICFLTGKSWRNISREHCIQCFIQVTIMYYYLLQRIK